jgi:kinesin family protein 18/19
MIANISPSSATYEDTHNTLLYANRAKRIKNKLERNTLNVNFHIGKYTQIIAQLKMELADMKFQLSKKDNEA